MVCIISYPQPIQASELRYMANADSFLYFPRHEHALAQRLMAELPSMIAFLKTKSIPVQRPLHVILDEARDIPAPEVHMIPHREIRLPLKAPGIFEDGYLAPNPWAYFLFKGLCLQGIYSMRSGIPGYLHKGFGELISPNIILPEWITDGVGQLLYDQYREETTNDLLNTAILSQSAVPDLDTVSNHPELWPGHYSYRIYGRPFIRFLHDRYGWDPLHDFLRRHGRGVIPIEIDLKAASSYGRSWPSLWKIFQSEHKKFHTGPDSGSGHHITGYWPKPFIYWNRSGVILGLEKLSARGRFGFASPDGHIWLSEYHPDGDIRLVRYVGAQPLWTENPHIWDPGPGGVAITRKGHRPYLLLFSDVSATKNFYAADTSPVAIPAPPGVIQLSGPVRDQNGRIAVTGNTAGNWDIWLYDTGKWHRITHDPTIQTDPWFREGKLLFATARSGRFEIIDRSGNRLSTCGTTALLPRGEHYLCLSANGWQVSPLKAPSHANKVSANNATIQDKESPEKNQGIGNTQIHLYSPLKSIQPNYLKPEVFTSGDNFQLGFGTTGMDVSGDYTLEAGVRYAFETDSLSLRLGASAETVGFRYTRYPLSYTTALDTRVDETRHEIKMFWQPWDSDELELSANFRSFDDQQVQASPQHEGWGALHLHDEYGRHRGWMDLELFSDQSRSLFGGVQLLFGERIFTTTHIQAGKTWGSITDGHNGYRIGGNAVEGYFTRRPSRLFPLRGFSADLLESEQAVTTGMEVFWPLANLQAGYQTLPLFFHRLLLGTFIDAGAAGDRITNDDILVAGGLELMTSMEVAWGNLTSFRLGIAWPLHQPGYLDEKGPVFLIQIGKPL